MTSRDPRTQELDNLRAALTMFALHLDIFEARMRSGLPKSVMRPEISKPPDIHFAIKIVSAMKNLPQD